MRLMTIEDYPQIYRLWNESEGMDINDIDESYEGISRYLQRNPLTCFVEERDGKIIGVIMSGHDGRRGTLHHLAVAKPYRRQGIGTSLMQAAMKALIEQGIRKTGLFVYRNNEIGISFWNKAGFIPHENFDYYDKENIF